MPLLCFASPKGGVGKTTLAANVCAEMARAGRRVLAIDLDPQNSFRVHFGVPLQDGAGFMAALVQQLDWRQALRRTKSGVGLLPYGTLSMDDAVEVFIRLTADPELLAQPLRALVADPELAIVVDSAPGPSPQLAAILPLADLLVTVLLVDGVSVSLIPSVEAGRAYGRSIHLSRVAFTLNQYDGRTRLGPALLSAAQRHLGTRLLGTVYRDESVAEAAAAQRFVADYAPSSKAAQDLASLTRVIDRRIFGRPPRWGWERTPMDASVPEGLFA
jgi:cellulose synthase operon protein YhjQ